MKASLDPHSVVERAARRALTDCEPGWIEYPFTPIGSDERQYGSPGFRIPTVTICKDKYYEYPEYHTSGDNLDFVRPENISRTLESYIRWFEYLEMNTRFRRSDPHGEAQLGRRGMFPGVGGSVNQRASLATGESMAERAYAVGDEERLTGSELAALSWIMFGCDGETDLLAIAERSGIAMPLLRDAAQRLQRHSLLTQVH
jgi:aminopeptidase-like protein